MSVAVSPPLPLFLLGGRYTIEVRGLKGLHVLPFPPLLVRVGRPFWRKSRLVLV